MDATFWAAVAGAGSAGLFALLGVWLTNRHAATERAADRQHELDLDRDRRGASERVTRRELALPALQRFSSQGELAIRQLEQCMVREGRIDLAQGVNLEQLQSGLADSLEALELVASHDALSAAQRLVRLIRPWDAAYWETDRSAEWGALGAFRVACRRDLFGDDMPLN